MTLEKLVERLNYHRELYYNGIVEDAPQWLEGEIPISDDEFDDLVEAIRKLDPNNPAIIAVGSANIGGVKHDIRMGSLAKVKNFTDFEKWFRTYGLPSCRLWVLPKYDGLSLNAVYENCVYKLSSTRGDGDTGEDVTANAARIKDIPHSVTGDLEARGECLMLRSVFDELNAIEVKAGRSPFKNPRNAASGSLKQGSPDICEQRRLSFFAYDIAKGAEGFTTYGQILERLSSLGFNTGNAVKFDVKDGDLLEVEAYITGFGKNRKNLDFATDGAVIVLDSLELQKKAGWSSDMHHPNGKIAFKFDPEQKTTKIIGIRPQVGKTGKIVPVAELEPVELDGSLVSNVTLHNFANVFNNGLGAGAEISVVKANDIIPYVKGVVKPASASKLERCPCCGSEIRYDDVNAWCDNEECPARLEARILHFLKTVECLGIGEKTVQALIKAGLLTGIKDLFEDTMTIPAISSALGNADPNAREAELVYEAIHGIKDLPFNVFIESLGIPHVGKGTSRKLSAAYGNPDSFVSGISYDELVKIDDIGDKTAASICKNVQSRKGEILRVACSVGIKQKVLTSDSLNGKSFLFTGTLSKPRKKFEEIVESHGGKLSGSVSKTLDYLVVGEDAGSKLAKAQKLGVKTLTEAEFMALAG